MHHHASPHDAMPAMEGEKGEAETAAEPPQMEEEPAATGVEEEHKMHPGAPPNDAMPDMQEEEETDAETEEEPPQGDSQLVAPGVEKPDAMQHSAPPSDALPGTGVDEGGTKASEGKKAGIGHVRGPRVVLPAGNPEAPGQAIDENAPSGMKDLDVESAPADPAVPPGADDSEGSRHD